MLTHLPEASFRRVRLSGSKLSGIAVSKGSFTDVEFRQCRLDFASFDEVKFKHVTFDGCRIREADFSRTSFDHVRFVDCDLARALFGRVRTANSEMRRCGLTELRGLGELRGFSMEWNDILAHAELFASALGIEIASETSSR